MSGFLLIGLVKYFWPFGWGISRNEWWGSLIVLIGLGVGGVGLTGSRAALPLYWAWMGIAYLLGNIMSRMIMALIYFGLFTPMRLLGTLVGRDRLQLKKGNSRSYWQDIDLSKRIEDYEKQF